VEFWQGRAGRLHDRIRFRQVEQGWLTERLAP
jgi:pyridoxamine 5'-phosphate oxidase